jgi:hypothetical protein
VFAETIERDRDAPVVDHLPHHGVDHQLQSGGHVPVVNDHLLEIEQGRTRRGEGTEEIGAVASEGTGLTPTGEVSFPAAMTAKLASSPITSPASSSADWPWFTRMNIHVAPSR